jgi:threonine dehydrogenase-like Zn-dependent dehydrogenase
MRAWQLVEPRLFESVESPRPEIGGDQILVRLHKAVLCGSDILKFNGMHWQMEYPLPVGMPIHECVGSVVESSSARFQVGDLVVAVPQGDRGLAEWYTADAARAMRVPEHLIQSEASLLIQPLSTVIYALDRLGDISDRTALVVGLGPIGLLATWLMKVTGVGRVIGVDPIAWRCQTARSFGAAQTFDLHSWELAQLIEQGREWQPVDICVEAVGRQPRTVNDCLRFVKRCGAVLTLGVPVEPQYVFDFNLFFRGNVQMVASVTPPGDSYMLRAADLVCQHERELASLITHRFGMDSVAEAFELYENPAPHRSLKVVVDATSW